MNLIISIDDFHNHNFFFLKPVKNQVFSVCEYSHLIYSDDHVTLNGVFLHLPFNTQRMEPYFNKLKCSLCLVSNVSLFNKVKEFEEKLLSALDIRGKGKEYTLYDSLMTGFIKVTSTSSSSEKKASPQHSSSSYVINYTLKIYGIWENEKKYGLTFKFLPF